MISCVMLCTWPKRASMISDALLSYDLQTYGDRELVVVNDGEPLAPAREDVTVANVPAGMSIGAKRNAGLDASSGLWLATWDDDDFSFPERLSLLVGLAAQLGASSARCDRMWIADEGMVLRALVRKQCYPTAVLRREDVLACGYPDISYCEDCELSYRMMLRGMREAVCGAPLYVHRRHGDNATAVRENLADNIRAGIPQRPGVTSGAQARLDSLLASPRDTLVVPA